MNMIFIHLYLNVYITIIYEKIFTFETNPIYFTVCAILYLWGIGLNMLSVF